MSFYPIEDPEKCINKIDTDELEDLVRETAVATLTNIIRSTALNEIAQVRHLLAVLTLLGTLLTLPIAILSLPSPSKLAPVPMAD